MRYKFIIFFLFISFVSKAQVYQLMPQYGYSTYRMNFDSTIQIPTFCGVPKLGSNVTKKGALAFDSCNNRFYFFNPKLQVWDTIKSADASLFVKYTDTASLVAPYLRKGDTIFLSQRIDQRVKYSDTSSMLAPYFKEADTSTLRRVKYVGLTMPSAFNVTGSPITDSGTIAVTGAGTASQYVRGDGQLANFPSNGGGGSSVNYYLNGSVNQGTFGGATYYQLSKVPTIGAGTNFTRTNAQGNGYIASFITDAGDPALLNIPGGNWNLEFYFNASSGGGSPSFYAEIYKVSATNVFTLIASGSTNPEGITQGTVVDQYFTSIPVPQTTLVATDRIAIRIFVTPSGRNITLHTEDNNLSEVLTTFSTGLNALNGLTAQVQYFATGTSGTDFNISSATDTHTFNLPTASATNRGALSSADWTTFNGKVSPSDTANKWITNVFRKTASDSVFFVRGGTNNFAFRDSTGAVGWGLLGNSGTNDATNFIGTTDNQDLVFRRNNVISGRIDSTNQASGNGGITALGFGANPTANNATAFGYKALARNTTTVNTEGNTAVGNLAGANITTESGNALLGNGASAVGNTYNNTAVGNLALQQNTTGNNTAIGYQCLRGTTSGTNNIGIGFFAGINNSNASNQVFINSLNRNNYSGDQTGSPFYAQQNATVTSQIVTLNGRVGINTISPSASAGLEVSSTTQGFLQPRLTTTQMNAISTPATGLSVFNTTDSVEYVYRGTVGGWQKNVIYNRNNDVALFNGANQRIMIDTTSNVVAGRSLTVEAGSTITQGTTAFTGLGQTSRNWIGMAAISNGDIYVSVLGGDIYKQTGGIGNFVALGQTTRNWYYMAAAPNNDVYACVLGGDIYKQTGGIGNFVALGQTTRNWYAMCAAPNGDVYASVSNGDIYKQTGGTGNFIALGQTTRNWQSMAAAPNGDIYAAEPNGDIYKQTGGTGNFIALSQTIRLWQGMTAASNGDIYINVSNGDIYKQTGGIGNFVALNQTSRNWGGMTQSSNGDIYAAAFGGDIFIQGAGTSNLNGGSLVLQSGVGKGTGTSTINFNTGTTLSSGGTLQTASTKMTILGNGNVGIGTTSPSAKLELSDTARGFLQTRMTTTQRNNIASPSVGLQVFTTTDSSQYVYRGTGAGWQQLANEIVNTGTLDFPSTNAQNSSDLTITLTGAVDGDAVVLGVPNAAVNANSCYTAWVSAANTVTVRFNNYSSGAINPASATFKVTIIK